jgi:hypothetical protein
MENRDNARSVPISRSSGLFVSIGWISAIISVFGYPFIFGVVGVIMGILATKQGSKSGLAVIVGSIVLMGIGLIFSGTIMNYTKHMLGL